MKLKKLIALLLTLALAFGLTGCVGNLYRDVATVEDTTVNSGLYLMLLHTAYQEADSKKENADKDLLSQKIEGKNANSWIRDRAEEMMRRYVAIRNLCREYDIMLDSTSQENVDQMMQYWQYMGNIYLANGISEITYQRYYTTEQLSRQLFNYLYSAEGPMAVDDAALKAEYAEKYAYVRMISIPLDSAADGEDVRDEVVDMAAKMVEKLRGGATMEAIAEKDVADAYEVLLREYDLSTAADNITTSYLDYNQPDSTTYPAEGLAEVKAAAAGNYGYMVGGNYVRIWEKLPMFAEEGEFESRRETVLSQLKKEEYEDYLRGIYDAYNVSWKLGAKWYYRPKKIKPLG